MQQNMHRNIKFFLGFTLIELIMVVSLVGILFTLASIFVARPISAYASAVARADLVDSADMTLRRIARDVQNAVPNSLRVKQSGSTIALEFLQTVEAMRYRANGPAALDFSMPITSFNVFLQSQFATINPTCVRGACRLIVYNTGATTNGNTDNPAPGANVYSTQVAPTCSTCPPPPCSDCPPPPCTGCLPPPGTVNITPVGTVVTIPVIPSDAFETPISLSPAVQFGLASPRQRLYISDTPVTYLCNATPGVENITRYSGYAINPVQPVNPAASPLNSASSAPVAQNVSACTFNYQPGTTERNALLIMSVNLSKGGETIFLTHEIAMENAP